jgi:predicted nucleic acid-binding protein
MRRRVILDTGPLVALLNVRDNYHDWAKTEFAQVEPPLLSCEAVFSEACFLLRTVQNGPEAVVNLLNRGVVEAPFCLNEEAERIKRLLVRYTSVPMSLADACLVRMAEQYAQAAFITLDNDFHIYRKHGRQVVPTIMPGVLP